MFETYKYYDLTKEEAINYYNEVVSTINSNWEKVAKKYGITSASINNMRKAFMLELLLEQQK